jgi:hypothetical protein
MQYSNSYDTRFFFRAGAWMGSAPRCLAAAGVGSGVWVQMQRGARLGGEMAALEEC